MHSLRKIDCKMATGHDENVSAYMVRHAFGLFDNGAMLGVGTLSYPSSLTVAHRYPYNLKLSCPDIGDDHLTFFIERCLLWVRTNDEQVVSIVVEAEHEHADIYSSLGFEVLTTIEGKYYIAQEGNKLDTTTVYRKAKKLGLSEADYIHINKLTLVSGGGKTRLRYMLRDRSTVVMYGEIYKIANTYNDRMYIGQTTCGLPYRMKRHIQDAKAGSDLLLYRAMRSIGIDNFKIEKLDEAFNPYDLDDLEAQYITKYDSVRNGYNLETGYSNDTYRAPDEVYLKAFELRSKKMSLDEIANFLGMSRRTVGIVLLGHIRPHLKAIWEADHEPLPEQRVMSEDDKYRIFEMRYNKGMTTYQIGEVLKTSGAYVGLVLSGKLNAHIKQRWEQEHGTTEYRHPEYLKPDEIERALKLVYIEGKSISETAKILDVKYIRIQTLVLGSYFSEEKEAFFAKHPKVNREYKIRDNPRRIPQEQVLAVLRCLFLEGKSARQVESELRLPYQIISDIASGRRYTEEIEQFYKDHPNASRTRTISRRKLGIGGVKIRDSEGNVFESKAAVARFYKCSESTVFHALKDGYTLLGKVTLQLVE